MKISRCLLLALSLVAASRFDARELQSLDADWTFHPGDVSGAEAASFDASDWRHLDVPHDWSIELPVDANAPSAGNGGFFQNGIGWYRRTLNAPESWRSQQVAVEFDGVYMNAEVWINGTSLGRHPYGYTPIRLDLTSHLKFGAINVIAVRVDNSAQPNSRWYSGSGIYRHVRLVVASPVHVASDGVFATTAALTDNSATVDIVTNIRNDLAQETPTVVETTVLAPGGGRVALTQTQIEIAPKGDGAATARVQLTRAQPWSPESPKLYRAVTRVLVDGRVVDEVTTTFGVRTIRVSAERGLELNGAVVEMNGGNVHHDNGILGAVALDRAEERRVELLKAAGFNAVRTSHNPPSPAFLDACDRIGLLVVDEAFDGWEKKKTATDYGVFFKEWSERDVAATVLRDRNHPSVVMWSIGNEVYERGSESGAKIAQTLTGRIRALDPSRPVTAGINGMGKNGDWTKTDPVFATLDVAGYNYEIARHADDHVRSPARVIAVTESYQSEVFTNWAITRDKPYVIGDFVWSAIDYLGESGIGRVFPPDEPVVKHWEGSQWPWHGAACGDIDLTGERKPISHYRAIVWERGEKLYAAVLTPTADGRPWNVSPWTVAPVRASWTWPGNEGRTLLVEVYSRHDAVRLYLNGKLLGEKPTTRTEQFKAAFAVPFMAGELKAVGVKAGREVENFILKTAGEPARLRVRADRVHLHADNEDLAFLTIDVLDKNGVALPNGDAAVRVAVEGPAVLAGLGNADMTSRETYFDNPHRLFEGRGLAVIRTKRMSGKIAVTVTSAGLASATIALESTK